MKIQLQDKLKVALKILRAIDLPRKFHDYLIIRPYVNGREEGFSVEVWGSHAGLPPAKVSFSENRNSDSIVVYAGPAKEFDAMGVPSEKIYDGDASRRFFDPGEYEKAAKFISRFLTTYRL